MSAWQNLEFRTWRKLSSGLCLWGQILVILVAVGRPILAVVGLSHGQGLLAIKKWRKWAEHWLAFILCLQKMDAVWPAAQAPAALATSLRWTAPWMVSSSDPFLSCFCQSTLAQQWEKKWRQIVHGLTYNVKIKRRLYSCLLDMRQCFVEKSKACSLSLWTSFLRVKRNLVERVQRTHTTQSELHGAVGPGQMRQCWIEAVIHPKSELSWKPPPTNILATRWCLHGKLLTPSLGRQRGAWESLWYHRERFA